MRRSSSSPRYTLDGRHVRAVRQAVHRLERDGYTTRVRRHRDIPADQMAEVIADADRWRDTDNERGFSMALGRPVTLWTGTAS